MPDPNTEQSPLVTRLQSEVREAQRAHDQLRIDTIRLALNAFHIEEVARTDTKHPRFRQPLTEDDRLALLEKQVKQRDEAAELYRRGGRPEKAEKEEQEAAILKTYLPQPLSEEEMRTIVAGIVAREGKDFKKVMPAAARETKGRADGRQVQVIVREMTS